MNLPNKLTLMRVIMIPFFMVFLLVPMTPYDNWIALAIFVIANWAICLILLAFSVLVFLLSLVYLLRKLTKKYKELML